MDEKQLTIKQLREVLDCSYPTALRFATLHGELITVPETNQEMWFIPTRAVEDRIDNLETEAQHLRDKLTAVFSNGANS